MSSLQPQRFEALWASAETAHRMADVPVEESALCREVVPDLLERAEEVDLVAAPEGSLGRWRQGDLGFELDRAGVAVLRDQAGTEWECQISAAVVLVVETVHVHPHLACLAGTEEELVGRPAVVEVWLADRTHMSHRLSDYTAAAEHYVLRFALPVGPVPQRC